MSIHNFIPTVWSENLYNKLNNRYVGVANCTREWEGEIKQCGSRVKICGLEPVSVFNYSKNTNLPDPEVLNDNARELVIDQAKAFNFQIDDIEQAQAKAHVMDAAIRQAADALANEADKYIYSLAMQSTEMVRIQTDSESMIDGILKAMLKVQTRGVSEELIFEVSPAVASVIYKDKLALSSNNAGILENGYLGSVAGCKIYVSNNILSEEEPNNITVYNCIMRSKRAVAFAEQLSEIEAYRPELRFADAVKGLHLYGAKIVRPEEFLLVRVAI